MGLKTDLETSPQRNGLLRLALDGDQEALGGLFAPYMRPLYHVALRLLRSPEEAEDTVQDGLLAALQHLREFQGRSKFSTWLTRIVVNAALMRLRTTRGRVVTSIDEEPLGHDHLPLTAKLADPKANPEEKYAQEEQFQILEHRLQSLPAVYRSALWLRDVQGMSTSEAAEVLGLPEGTLKARLHRGRQRISKQVREALVQRGPFNHAAALANEVVEPAA